jgi:hypothetical protein
LRNRRGTIRRAGAAGSLRVRQSSIRTWASASVLEELLRQQLVADTTSVLFGDPPARPADG